MVCNFARDGEQIGLMEFGVDRLIGRSKRLYVHSHEKPSACRFKRGPRGIEMPDRENDPDCASLSFAARTPPLRSPVLPLGDW